MIEGALWEDSLFVLDIALLNDSKHIEGNYLLAFCLYQVKDYVASKDICKKLRKLKIDQTKDEELLESFLILEEDLDKQL